MKFDHKDCAEIVGNYSLNLSKNNHYYDLSRIVQILTGFIAPASDLLPKVAQKRRCDSATRMRLLGAGTVFSLWLFSCIYFTSNSFKMDAGTLSIQELYG
jgi:hypothetical protein